MSTPQAIDSFQFRNLIENRIPFILLNFDSFVPENKTIQDLQKVMTPPRGLAKVFPRVFGGWARQGVLQLKEQGLDPSTAFVVVCPRGKWAPVFQAALEARGFMNSYYVEGGWRSQGSLGKRSSTV